MLTACSTPGLLYTDITRPLTLDMQRTTRAPDVALGSQNVFREPFTRAGLRAEWSGYAPGQTARRGGLDTVHYADIRRQSFLGGLWSRTTVVVYGNKEDTGASAGATLADPRRSNPALARRHP